MSDKRRADVGGFALATTFIVAFMVLLAGFTMAGIASFNYNLAKQTLLREEAFEGANAGLNLAMAQLIQDSAWGSSQPTDRTANVLPSTSITSSVKATDPVTFYVSFLDPASSPPHPGYPTDLPFSVNNFNGSISLNGPVDPRTGSPREVPPGSALIFVEAQAGQGSMVQIRIIEALLQAPAYQYAVSAYDSVVDWCTFRGFYKQDAYRASKIDGLSPQDLGSIFVGPQKGQKYPACPPCTGGYCGGKVCCPGATGPFGAYLGPGSVVTGRVNHFGRTNIVAVCPAPTDCIFPPTYTWPIGPPCGQWACPPFSCRPPEAMSVSTPNPANCCVMPKIASVVRTCATKYLCKCNYCYHGPGPGYTFYTRGKCGFNPCLTIVNADTLIEPTACAGCVTLGSKTGGLCGTGKPVIFTCNYTLTIHGYATIPGGVASQPDACHRAGCCKPCNPPIFHKATATILILPVNVPACGQTTCQPNCTKYSSLTLWPYVTKGAVGADSGVSLLATGNVQMLDPRARCAVYSCPQNSGVPETPVHPYDGWFTLNGIAVVMGNISFQLGSTHIKGMIMATNPWAPANGCGKWGNVFFQNGIWVSYAPALARASWIGQAVAPSSTVNGMTVVYWRDVSP